MKPSKPLRDNEPQDIEDRHDEGYDNDVKLSSWLRNGDATTKPSFDKGNAWRKGRGL